MENDWLSRQIEIVTRTLSVILLGRDTPANIMQEDAKDQEGLTIQEEALLVYMLKKYISQGEINKAENLLFENIRQSQSPGCLQIALSFYDELNRLDDDYLTSHDFSRQEILDGLGDIQKIYKSHFQDRIRAVYRNGTGGSA